MIRDLGTLLLALALGFSTRRLASAPSVAPPRAAPAAPARPNPTPAPRAPVEARAPAPACVPTPACDCPPSFAALPGVPDPETVEAWIDGLRAACPTFADRPSVVDCSEPPCLLAVDVTGLPGPRFDPAPWSCGRLGGEDAPPHAVVGYSTRSVGEAESVFTTVAFRPADTAPLAAEAWRVLEVHPPLPE